MESGSSLSESSDSRTMQPPSMNASSKVSFRSRLVGLARYWYRYIFSAHDLRLISSENFDPRTTPASELPPSVIPTAKKFYEAYTHRVAVGGEEVKLPLLRTFFALYWVRLVLLVIPHLVSKVLQSVIPLFVYSLLSGFALESQDRPYAKMIGVAFLSAFVQLLKAFSHEVAWHRTHELRIELMKIVDYVLYRKTLLVPLKATKEETNAIASLLSTDPWRVANPIFFLFDTPSFLMSFVVAFWYLYALLGWGGMLSVGLVIFVVMVPINLLFLRKANSLDKSKVEHMDARVSMVKEAIESIRFIKAYSWEALYQKKIELLRELELGDRRKQCYYWSGLECVWTSTTFFATAGAILGYIFFSGATMLTLPVCFSVITVVGSVSHPIFGFANNLNTLCQANVSRKRILKYMHQPSVVDHLAVGQPCGMSSIDAGEKPSVLGVVVHAESDDEMSSDHGFQEVDFGKEEDVILSSSSFSWPKAVVIDDEDKKEAEEAAFVESKSSATAAANAKPVRKGPFLEDIHLRIAQGEFIAVVGAVGSGKTALANALLGELHHSGGKVRYSADIRAFGYCAQEHWVVADTVRSNILFGEQFDPEKYAAVVAACQLTSDLAALPQGDLTMVGERGTRLSGGQQARIALARACYGVDSCDFYVFDDPLKDLDAKVGNAVFRSVFSKWLIGKTRLLFTHNVQCLPHVDRILVMEEGKIAHSGSFRDLQAVAVGIPKDQLMMSPLSPFSPTAKDAADGLNDGKKSPSVEFRPQEDNDDEKRLEELSAKGFKWRLLVDYFFAKPFLFGGFLLTVVVKCVGEFYRDSLLGWWAEDDGVSPNHPSTYYVAWYLGVGMVVAAIVGIGQLLYSTFALSVAQSLHNSMLFRVIRAKVPFFDAATSGNILSRFSKDMDKLDDDVRWRTREFWMNSSWILFTYIFVIIYVPWFALLLLPPFVAFLYWGRTFVKAYFCLTRFEVRLHSPILTHFNESVKGLTTIRAFRKQEFFSKKMEDAIDLTYSIDMIDSTVFRWISIRGRWCAISILLSFTLLSLYLGISGTVAAIALSRIYNMEFDLTWLLMLIPSIQKDFISVERIQEYSRVDIEEFGGRIPDSSDFPATGSVELKNVSFRYGEEGDDVIKDVSMLIPGGCSVGICGRTGSGKSTLVKLLLRMYDVTGGHLLLDGEDVATISLASLRKGLSYIAQNPTLLDGTVRENLDAESQWEDSDVWRCLEQVGLKEKVQGAAKALDTKVDEGISFSAGEKQLVCFARALLHKKNLLVMDESTSSCDLQTDARIKETVDRCFSGCTVLSIAHRLETIMDYDRIAVMKDGRLVEYDTPAALVHNPDSELRELVMQTGRQRASRLIAMADAAQKSSPD